MGAPPLKAILLGAGPIKVAARDLVRPGIKSTSQWVIQSPVNRSPVNRSPVNQSPGNLSSVIHSPVIQSPVNQSPVNQAPFIQSPVNQAPVNQSPVISHPVTGQPGTSQPGISFQSFAYDLQTQLPSGYLPINMPLQNYAPSISSHISHGSVRRLPNVIIPGYEHSERSEFPNPATSSKQLIPLEPDFSQISDLSVMIDPPNSTDISQTRPSRKEQSKRDHKSKKRRRHRSSSSSPSTSRSDSLSSSRRKKNSKRSKHSQKKRRRRSMTPSSSSSNTSQSQLDIGRYTRAHKSPQVVHTPTPIQPEEPSFIPVNTQPINFDQFQPNLPQPNKESDSETESEVWSFDHAINEVFWLLPPELCPKTQQDQAP